MLTSLPLAVHLLDAASVLHAFGPFVLVGMAVLVFIESGVLFPFLPGDSLLVTAAIISGTLGITPWEAAAVASLAAIAGDQVGYGIGRRFGRRLFRDDARLLTTARLEEAEAFFSRWGGLSLVLGRFVPVVRTYVPLAAGTAHMHYRRFLLFNLTGAIAWAAGLTAVGVLLGGIPFVADHIDVLMIVVVVVSVLPIVIGVVRRRHATRLAEDQRPQRPASSQHEGQR
jgi:membrane protein DedA with SNARE-associated domain